MKRKDIISITGDLASGQSTVAKMLANDLEYYFYHNGAYFRQLAIEKNMSVTEFGEYVEKHPEIDMQIEKSAAEYAKKNNNIVIDAKMGWYAVPESFKVYLMCYFKLSTKWKTTNQTFLQKNEMIYVNMKIVLLYLQRL